MDAAPDNLNPFTGKKRKISHGSELGDKTEAYHALETRVEKRDWLKKHPELQRYFPLDQFADLPE